MGQRDPAEGCLRSCGYRVEKPISENLRTATSCGSHHDARSYEVFGINDKKWEKMHRLVQFMMKQTQHADARIRMEVSLASVNWMRTNF